MGLLLILCSLLYLRIYLPHQWRSGNAQNWKSGGTRFKPRLRLSILPFGVFRGFLRNSCEYGVGSFRKTPTEGTPPIGPGPTSGQLALTYNPTLRIFGSRSILIQTGKVSILEIYCPLVVRGYLKKNYDLKVSKEI